MDGYLHRPSVWDRLSASHVPINGVREKLHHDVRDVVLYLEVMGRDYIGMREASR